MLYPTQESFVTSFASEDQEPSNVAMQKLGDDHILGVRGPLLDEEYEEVFERVKLILRDLGLTSPEYPAVQSI